MDRLTLLYDRDCGFCRTALGAILMRDRAGLIRPVALQDPEARALLPEMDEQARMASFHLALADGSVLSAGAALTGLLRALPAGRALGALAGAVQPLTDAAYTFIAANRNRIGPIVPAGWRSRAGATIARRQAELGLASTHRPGPASQTGRA